MRICENCGNYQGRDLVNNVEDIEINYSGRDLVNGFVDIKVGTL